MAYKQFVGDELLTFYGTTQEQCVSFRSALPEQLVGMVPTDAVTTDCVQDPCYTLCVFGEDINAFLYDYPDTTNTPVFELQSFDGSVWSMVANPMGANEGTFFDFGSFPDYPSYAGFKIDWSLIESNHGLGTYRFVVITPNPTDNLISLPFQLKEDTCANKNGTFKIEMTNQGNYFNFNYTPSNNRLRKYDLINMVWEDSIRYFGVAVKTETESEDVLINYQNRSNLMVYSEDVDTYDLNIPIITQQLTQRLYRYGFKAEDIKLTDFNTKNQTFYNQLPIVSNGSYSFERLPRQQNINTVSIPVKHEFVSDYKKT